MATTYYSWTWDVDTIRYDGSAPGSLAVYADDGTTDGLIEITSGTYTHAAFDITIAGTTYADLQGDLEAGSPSLNVISPNFASTLVYSVSLNATGSLDFRDDATPNGVGAGSNSGKMLAALLGFNYQHANASGGSASNPYDIVLSGAQTYVSNCRPYCIILPTIQGRTDVSDEYETDGIASESSADDGTHYVVAVDGSAILTDWMQTCETDTPPSTHSDDGMAVFKRNATAEVPWSYQHAWEHARTSGSAPFVLVDNGTTTYHELRAEALSFRPQRFASKDFSLWSIPFRTRQLEGG